MYKDVSNVGAMHPTDGNTGEDLVLVSRREFIRLQQERNDSLNELNRIKREREEYRKLCLDFAESVPKVQKIADNIETILSGGASK